MAQGGGHRRLAPVQLAWRRRSSAGSRPPGAPRAGAWTARWCCWPRSSCCVAAAVAPLLLCGLAFGLTSQIGWGAVFGAGARRGAHDRDRVRGDRHGRACEAVVAVPGTDQTLSFDQMAQLMTLAVGTAMVGFAAYRIAGQLVGSPGVLGIGARWRGAVGVAGAAAGRMAGRGGSGGAAGIAAGRRRWWRGERRRGEGRQRSRRRRRRCRVRGSRRGRSGSRPGRRSGPARRLGGSTLGGGATMDDGTPGRDRPCRGRS